MHDKTRRLYCVKRTQYSIRPFARSGPLYVIGLSLGPPESLTQTVSRSLHNVLQDSLGDRPTDRPADHATGSFTIGGIYLRSTEMYNNNCSICRILDCFPCLYRRTEQGSRRQQTRLRFARGVESHT